MLLVKTRTESARSCAGENALEDHDGAQFSKRIKALEGCSEVCEASGVSDDCSSSQSHSISHLSHDVDSSVVNSVSVSPVSAPLSAGLSAACGVAAVGSVGSVEGGGARVGVLHGMGWKVGFLVLVFHLCSQCMYGMMQIRVWTR